MREQLAFGTGIYPERYPPPLEQASIGEIAIQASYTRVRMRIGNSNGLFTPPRRPRLPSIPPPPAPPHLGCWRAAPRAAPARRRGLQPDGTRGRRSGRGDEEAQTA